MDIDVAKKGPIGSARPNPVSGGGRPSFASFWLGGALSPYEQACTFSIVERGYELTLFSFEPVSNLPAGVRTGDARELVDERFTKGFLIKGKPSLSHFSDLFRYRLFQATDHIWIDSDMLMLREIDVSIPSLFIAREDTSRLCGAIMRIDARHPRLPALIRETQRAAWRELAWGETGPRLLTRAFGVDALAAVAFEPELFYPVHYTEFWKVFLPEHREECEEACRRAYTVHLWNSVVGELGVWKRFLPPVGSYLHSRFSADGTDRFFTDAYPENVMRQMIENWRLRSSGGDLALGQLVRQIIPGLKRTAKRRKVNLIQALRRV